MEGTATVQATRIERLGIYAEGWTNGDAERILEAAAPGYVFDDPNSGQITRAEFPTYMEGLKHAVQEMGGGRSDAPFMAISEVVTSEGDDLLTAWCWWAIPGTPIAGSGLIKVGDDGVVSERIAYYTRLPE